MLFLRIAADVEDARVARWHLGGQPGSATDGPTPLHDLPSCCVGPIYGVTVPDQPGAAELIVVVGGREFRFAYEIVARAPQRIRLDSDDRAFSAFEIHVSPGTGDVIDGTTRTIVSMAPELVIARRVLASPSRVTVHGIRSDGTRVLASRTFVPTLGFVPSWSLPGPAASYAFGWIALTLVCIGCAVATVRSRHRRGRLDPPSARGGSTCGR